MCHISVTPVTYMSIFMLQVLLGVVLDQQWLRLIVSRYYFRLTTNTTNT